MKGKSNMKIKGGAMMPPGMGYGGMMGSPYGASSMGMGMPGQTGMYGSTSMAGQMPQGQMTGTSTRPGMKNKTSLGKNGKTNAKVNTKTNTKTNVKANTKINTNVANNNSLNNSLNTENTVSSLESNIQSYKMLILACIVILILCIIGYFASFSYRQSKALYNLAISKSYMFIHSQVNTRENRDHKLCDFYMACAFRPYMVKNQLLDYCSIEVMREILMGGARCVYLEIFNNTLNEDAYPIVTTGFKEGEWKLGLNSLLFEDVCNAIATIVFSNGYVNNYRDPFILCLNLNTNGNVKCLNKIKNILYKVFKSNLLSNDYTYSSRNMAEVKIKELLGKVVILSSDGYQNSQLEELINYSWDKSEINKIGFGSLDPYVSEKETIKYDSESLRDFNKNNLTMVMPSENSFFTKNYDPKYAWDSGCQMVFINYNTNDKNYDSYLTKFRNDSFLKKPENMLSVVSDESAPMDRLIQAAEEAEAESTTLNCPNDDSVNGVST